MRIAARFAASAASSRAACAARPRTETISEHSGHTRMALSSAALLVSKSKWLSVPSISSSSSLFFGFWELRLYFPKLYIIFTGRVAQVAGVFGGLCTYGYLFFFPERLYILGSNLVVGVGSDGLQKAGAPMHMIRTRSLSPDQARANICRLQITTTFN